MVAVSVQKTPDSEEVLMEPAEEMARDFDDDIFEEIGEAIWINGTFGRVTISEKDRHDVINSSGSGFITTEEKEMEFTFRNGDWNGLEIRSYGETVHYEPPKPRRTVFVLDESRIPENNMVMARAKFRAMKTEIEEMAGKYDYDMFFSPTNQIRKHYEQWAEKNFLTTASEEV